MIGLKKRERGWKKNKNFRSVVDFYVGCYKQLCSAHF